jgi:pimeloyl-ACP methyl ester carboxylesterase
MSLLPLRRRGRSPGPLAVREGLLHGGLPYLAVGHGPPLVVLPGFRAEHANPTGPERRFSLRPLRPLARQFTVYLVSRKPGLPAGATIADLAADYAEALERTFTSPVAVVGSSTGGSIAQQLAIDHPELVDRLVLVASACRLGPGGRRMQRDLARLTLAGRPRRAWAATGPGLAATTVGGQLYGALLWLFGPKLDPADPSDMLIVVDAEDRFDAAPQLHRVTAPTLVVAGDRDRNYTPELFWETAARIPGARLRLYPGKGHAGIATLAYKPAVRELLGFLRERGADGGHHNLFQMPVFRVLVGARGLPQRLADTVRRRGDQAGMSSAAPTFRLRDRPSMGWMVLGEPPAPQQVAPGVWLVTVGRGVAGSNVYLVGSGRPGRWSTPAGPAAPIGSGRPPSRCSGPAHARRRSC